MLKLEKKGQLTLFIILAILIAGLVVVFFIYIQLNFIAVKSQKLYIESCVEKVLEKYVNEMSLSAGVINPEFVYSYQGENITVACYSDEYYKPCVVQIPFFKQTLEQSLSKKINSQVKLCYENAVDELVAKGYGVEKGKITYTTGIDPEGVRVIINAPITASAEGAAAINSRKIEVLYNSEIYKIVMIATSILQFEVSYGDAESTNFNLFYPDISVEKIRSSEGMKVYVVSDKKNIYFKFASRSYAWPPGYGLT